MLLRDPAFDVGAFAANYAREQASKLLARST
jgi:hypothetical protein